MTIDILVFVIFSKNTNRLLIVLLEIISLLQGVFVQNRDTHKILFDFNKNRRSRDYMVVKLDIEKTYNC